MAHKALFCSDVVREISSYLPAADIFSLVECGSRLLNRLLLDVVKYCLTITARDVDVFPISDAVRTCQVCVRQR